MFIVLVLSSCSRKRPTLCSWSFVSLSRGPVLLNVVVSYLVPIPTPGLVHLIFHHNHSVFRKCSFISGYIIKAGCSFSHFSFLCHRISGGRLASLLAFVYNIDQGNAGGYGQMVPLCRLAGCINTVAPRRGILFSLLNVMQDTAHNVLLDLVVVVARLATYVMGLGVCAVLISDPWSVLVACSSSFGNSCIGVTPSMAVLFSMTPSSITAVCD